MNTNSFKFSPSAFGKMKLISAMADKTKKRIGLDYSATNAIFGTTDSSMKKRNIAEYNHCTTGIDYEMHILNCGRSRIRECTTGEADNIESRLLKS